MQSVFDSNELKGRSLVAHWIGPTHPFVDYGPVKFDSVRMHQDLGTLTINADGSLRLVNNTASGTIAFLYSAHHPTGTDDPDAGMEISDQLATITLTPVGTSVSPTDFRVAQGGTMIVAAQADNSRTSGKTIVRIATLAPSRAPTNVPATWTIAPVDAGKMSGANYDGSYTFTGEPNFIGSFTLTAHVIGAKDQPTTPITGTAIAHPVITVSSPTEKQTVVGTINAKFVFQNTTDGFWRVDSGKETLVTGDSFPLDTTLLTNGVHYLNFRAVGPVEEVSMARKFIVNNPHEFKPWSGLIAYSQRDVSDGPFRTFANLITPTGSQEIAGFGSDQLIRWSPDGKYITDGRHLVNRDGTRILTWDRTWDSAFEWFPDSSGILTGFCLGPFNRLLTNGTIEELASDSAATYGHNPAFSRDGQWVYFVHHEHGTYAYLRRVTVTSMLARTYPTENLIKFDTSFNEQVILKATVEGNVVFAYGKSMVLFNPETKSIVARVDGDLGTVYNIELSPDGKYLAVQHSSWVGVVSATTLATVLEIMPPLGSGIQSFAWSPDSTGIAVSNYDDSVTPVEYRVYICRIDDPIPQEILKRGGFGKAANKTRGYEVTGSSLSWTTDNP
jgi:WD40 repeat protein